MTYKEYYGSHYLKLLEAEKALINIAENLKNENNIDADIKSIVYYCTRIKKPESMVKKLESRGFPTSCHSALNDVYDAVGLRIICSFDEDVYSIVSQLQKDNNINVILEKDYLSCPKPNGYRSYHICARLKELGILAEIQVRTIAMDFWATLEHQIKYKKDISNESLIRKELKRCASEIASVDLSMQTIREILRDYQ